MTCYFIITGRFLQFYGMYYMYYYFPQMLEYQDIQSICILTTGVLLYTDLKCCTPSAVLCLIACKIWAKVINEAVSHLNGYSWAAGLPGTYCDSCRQTLREARELKGDYLFYSDHTVLILGSRSSLQNARHIAKTAACMGCSEYKVTKVV